MAKELFDVSPLTADTCDSCNAKTHCYCVELVNGKVVAYCRTCAEALVEGLRAKIWTVR